MESFVNNLTATNVELTLSYSETLNSLVNYNSELTYNPSSSKTSTNQRTAQPDISRKLPTKLSKNPSTYEKELRDLVLNLYSDEERPVEEHNHSVDMASFTQDRMIQGPQIKGASFWGAQKVTVSQPLDMMHMTEPHQGQSESGSEGYGSLDNSATQIEENGIQNLQELQGYLVKLQNSKQEMSSRNISFSSDQITPLFDDSGIHLEFTMPSDTGIYEVDIDEPDTNGERDEVDENRDFHRILPEFRGRSPSVVGEEGVEDEADGFLVSDRLAGQCSGFVTQGRDDQRSISIEDFTPKNASRSDYEKDVDIEIAEGVAKEQDSRLIQEQKSFTRENYHDLALQRANLEGKLESLQEEFASVLEDRKSLQIRLQTVEARLREEVLKARETKPTAVSLVDELRRNKCELESQLVKLQSAYEEKHGSLNEALEQLKTSSTTIQNLKQKLSLLEGEICRREETVSALQAEMDSLKKLLEEAKEQNEEFKKENMALNANIARLVDAKEWLQKQLGFAQDARAKLQLEASEFESTLAAKNHMIEQLKCEGARSSQQLTELQQSSLVEKAQILKHMEQVEESITQQNLAVKEMEIDKQSVEKTLGARVKSLTSENNRLLKLMSSAVEVQKELDAAKQDVVLKEALLETIVKEKEEVKEQLKLARESTEEYKRNLHELESKFDATKRELKMAQDDIGEKECYIEKLQEEKKILKENLDVATKERLACDNAIHTLRLDLEKVDRRFKLMKRELTAKNCQLEETTRQKDMFVGELRTLREGLENQVALSCAVKEELAQKEKLVEEFQELKDALEKDIARLTQQLEHSRGEIARVVKERNDIQEQLQTAVRDTVVLEEKFHTSLLERARLEGELESTQQSNQTELEALRNQNLSLREEITTERTNLQAEVTKGRDNAINLEQELKYLTDEIIRKEGKHNKEMQSFGETLEEMKNRKEMAEQELKMLHKITEQSVAEMKKSYESQLEEVQTDVLSLQEEKAKIEQDYEVFRKKSENQLGVKNRDIRQMEKELSFLKETLQQRKAEIENLQMCAIEFERLKGRLAGVLTSQKTLREHVVKMESDIATRESALVEAANELQRLKKDKELQQKTASEKIGSLEKQLTNVGQEKKNLQDSFRKERQENIALRRKIEENADEKVDLIKKLSDTEKHIKQLQERVKSEGDEMKRCRSQLEGLKESFVEEQTARENVQRRLEAVLEQEAVKDRRMESLEWEVTRRTKEVEYLKEQLRMMEERQQLEMENLKTALQVSRSETTSLRSELSEARKAKCSYQTKTFELKDSLLTARQATESLKQELFVKRQELNSLVNDVLASSNLQLLQEEVTTKREATSDCEETRDDTDGAKEESVNTFRPISGLQECMSLLRSQISNLQKQMNDHTDSVQTATVSWRSFKENVHQLQASCNSQNSQLLTAEKDK